MKKLFVQRIIALSWNSVPAVIHGPLQPQPLDLTKMHFKEGLSQYDLKPTRGYTADPMFKILRYSYMYAALNVRIILLYMNLFKNPCDKPRS